MKRKLVALSGLAVMVAVLQVNGCVALIPPQTVPFALGSSDTFQVEACVARENRLTVTDFDLAGFTIVRGSMTIDSSTITITPDADQTGECPGSSEARTFTIEVRLGAKGTEGTVCDDGERFGPYVVELDEDFKVVSITPSSVTLSQNAVDLLNGGDFVLCITVDTDFSGTIVVDEFLFTVTLG